MPAEVVSTMQPNERCGREKAMSRCPMHAHTPHAATHSGQQVGDVLLDLAERDVEARRDDTGLVDPAVELDNNLAGAVVVDDLELADVA